MNTKYIFLISTLFLLVVMCGCVNASAYRQITLSPSTPVANYQVNITLTAANFDYSKLAFPANGSDIYFKSSNGTILSHWIESWVNGGTSTIWVNVTNSGTSTINMYYGNNSSVPTSNGDTTFDLFDDFNINSIVTPFTSGSIWSGNPYDAWGMSYVDPNNSNQLVYFYRNGPSHAVDASAKINRAVYNISANTWSATRTTVYETTAAGIEDRQISGGVINGTVYGFVTRYNVTNSAWQDIVITKTTNNGDSWTTIDTIIPPGNWSWFQVWGHLIQADNGTWYIPWYGKNTDTGMNYVNLLQSTDSGNTWSFGPTVANSTTKQYTESDIVSIGGGKMLALIRDDNNGYLTQSRSSNNGTTWETQGDTNLGSTTKQWSPSMVYDSQTNKIVTVFVKIGDTGSAYYISEADPLTVFNNPSAYTSSVIATAGSYANNALIEKIGTNKYYVLWSTGFPSSTTVYGGIYATGGKWTVLDGSAPTFSNGIMTVDNGWIKSGASFGTNYTMRAYGKMSATTVKQEFGFSAKTVKGADTDIQNAIDSISILAYNSAATLYIANNKNTGASQVNGGTYNTNYTIYEISRNGTTNTKFLHNGTAYTGSPISTNVPTVDAYIHFLDVNTAGNSQWDWVAVKKYSNNEPATTIGSEQNSITSIGDITGETIIGSTLTAGSCLPAGSTVTYQWQRSSTSGGTYSDISSATSSTYTLVAADVGNYIRVVVTGSGNYYGTVNSNVTTQVKADFSASPVNGTLPLTVNFTSISNNSLSVSWDFGDGTSSTQQNPTHTYNVIGNYSVNLTVTNNQGSFSTLKPNYITVLPVAPVANFSATPVLGTLPFNVSFSDTSTGTPTSWSWDFGDGATNNSQNPTYQYTTYGLFTVTLTATNAVGSNTTIKTGYITVNPPIASGLPIASFTQNATISGYPLTVQFVDTSITNTNSDTPTYLWNFGDGNTSTLQNPIHVYTLPGLYNATLNVTNMAGSNISSQIIRIDVSSVTTLISPLSQASIDNMKIVNINSTVISGGTSSLFSSVTSSISSGYSLMALCILIIGAVGILRYLDYL